MRSFNRPALSWLIWSLVPVLTFAMLSSRNAPPAFATPARQAVLGTQSDDLSEYVNGVIASVDSFWTDVANQKGWTYYTATVQLLRDGVPQPSPCDNGAPPSVAHAYCPQSDTITLDMDSSDPDSFTSDINNNRDGVVIFTVAHEWGHHIQNILGTYSQNTLTDELQADCLAGAFTKSYSGDPKWQSEVDDTIASVRESGSPADAERTHGTPAERAEAFNRGYSAGSVSACGL